MITFVNVFLMVDEPWVCISRPKRVSSYCLTKSSLERLVGTIKELPGYFNIDNVGWTWTREEL